MSTIDNRLNETASLIRSICASQGIVVFKMILFGSRARDDFREDSDYDFIAICKHTLTHSQKMKIWLLTSRTLSEKNITADIIFKSEEEYQKDIHDTGKVTYYAHREGVLV